MTYFFYSRPQKEITEPWTVTKIFYLKVYDVMCRFRFLIFTSEFSCWKLSFLLSHHRYTTFDLCHASLLTCNVNGIFCITFLPLPHRTVFGPTQTFFLPNSQSSTRSQMKLDGTQDLIQSKVETFHSGHLCHCGYHPSEFSKMFVRSRSHSTNYFCTTLYFEFPTLVTYEIVSIMKPFLMFSYHRHRWALKM